MEKIRIEINGVAFDMLPIEGGSFVMGATSEQHGEAWENEAPTHSVNLGDYYLGETVVTRALWQAVMEEADAEGGAPELPVTGKSWQECQTFIQKLNIQTGRFFRLPTEAEWEYAARGGNRSRGFKYAGSNNLDEVAWYDKNSGGMIHPVRMKKPNELGLYDMSGNVWEWCFDWYGTYERYDDEADEVSLNPIGPKRGSQRVARGASCNYYAQSCRVSCRFPMEPSGQNYATTGFRLALDERSQLDDQSDNKASASTESQPAQPKTAPATGGGKPKNGSSSHYWNASTGKKKRRKKKVWPWILAALVVLFVVLLGSLGEENKPIVDPVEEIKTQQANEERVINSLAVEIENKIDDAQDIFESYRFIDTIYDSDFYEEKVNKLNKGADLLYEAAEKTVELGSKYEQFSTDGLEERVRKLAEQYNEHRERIMEYDRHQIDYMESRHNSAFVGPIKQCEARLAQLEKLKTVNIIW